MKLNTTKINIMEARGERQMTDCLQLIWKLGSPGELNPPDDPTPPTRLPQVEDSESVQRGSSHLFVVVSVLFLQISYCQSLSPWLMDTRSQCDCLLAPFSNFGFIVL